MNRAGRSGPRFGRTNATLRTFKHSLVAQAIEGGSPDEGMLEALRW